MMRWRVAVLGLLVGVSLGINHLALADSISKLEDWAERMERMAGWSRNPAIQRGRHLLNGSRRKPASSVRAPETDGLTPRRSGTAPACLPTSRHIARYSANIDRAARRYGVPTWLIAFVIQIESNFNPTAVSAAGARGLMQILPSTAEKDLGVSRRDLFNPAINIDAGTRYLARLLQQSGGHVMTALAAYNFGPGNVARRRRLPEETRDYLDRFREYYLRLGQEPHTECPNEAP